MAHVMEDVQLRPAMRNVYIYTALTCVCLVALVVSLTVEMNSSIAKDLTVVVSILFLFIMGYRSVHSWTKYNRMYIQLYIQASFKDMMHRVLDPENELDSNVANTTPKILEVLEGNPQEMQ